MLQFIAYLRLVKREIGNCQRILKIITWREKEIKIVRGWIKKIIKSGIWHEIKCSIKRWWI